MVVLIDELSRELRPVDGDRPVGMLHLDDALQQAGVPIGLGLS